LNRHSREGSNGLFGGVTLMMEVMFAFSVTTIFTTVIGTVIALKVIKPKQNA
jgi:hypothetical protein